MGSKIAKKRIVVRRKRSIPEPYTPPKLPAKPKVTVGAHCYGRSKRGGYIIPRFWITQYLLLSRIPKKTDPWFVIDMETGCVAKGTKDLGYSEKDKAIAVARKYRDKYGAWYVMPF